MRPFQRQDCLFPDPAHQLGPIAHDVAAQVGVADGTSAVHVERVEAQGRRGTDAAIVRRVPLAIPGGGTTAAHTGLVRVPEPDVLVEDGLAFLQVLRPALQLLLPRLDLPAVAVGYGLPRRLGVLVLDGQGAGRRADLLRAAEARGELLAACRVLAFLRFGLAGG